MCKPFIIFGSYTLLRILRFVKYARCICMWVLTQKKKKQKIRCDCAYIFQLCFICIYREGNVDSSAPNVLYHFSNPFNFALDIFTMQNHPTIHLSLSSFSLNDSSYIHIEFSFNDNANVNHIIVIVFSTFYSILFHFTCVLFNRTIFNWFFSFRCLFQFTLCRSCIHFIWFW